MKRRFRRSIACCIATVLVRAAEAVAFPETTEWRFDVFLDDKPIGYHRFHLNQFGVEQELLSEARFNVKLLFITVYRYAHDNRELWDGDCLKRIDAHTDDNGVRRTVVGSKVVTHFALAADGRDFELTQCVMTFAYWNPSILEASHLLNPQTGEYVPVRVAHIGTEIVAIRGSPQTADHYRLVGVAKLGGAMQIDLWYSANKTWLALESATQDGRRLRYRLQ